MSQINCNGVTYKNFAVAIGNPKTWNVNYFENFDCNHWDCCVRRCPLCKNIVYDLNNHCLWMNSHIPHTYTATCLTKTCKFYDKHF